MIKCIVNQLFKLFKLESESIFIINLDDTSREETTLSCDFDKESEIKKSIIDELSSKSYRITDVYISKLFDEYKISDINSTHSGRLLIYHQIRRKE